MTILAETPSQPTGSYISQKPTRSDYIMDVWIIEPAVDQEEIMIMAKTYQVEYEGTRYLLSGKQTYSILNCFLWKKHKTHCMDSLLYVQN